MSAQKKGDEDPTYDRQLLLGGAKRNAVLELWEVKRYGIDSYGDADYVSIYGMRPADWYAKGVRLLGRTAVECTRDGLGDAIGKDIAAIAGTAPPTAETLVIDPFAGSGNTLYWMLRHLPGAQGLGFELDAAVFQLTTRNLAALASRIKIMNTDYRTGVANGTASTDRLLITFIAPPWGDALSRTSGLDLRRTTPPITGRKPRSSTTSRMAPSSPTRRITSRITTTIGSRSMSAMDARSRGSSDPTLPNADSAA
jgi:hypothetical protein